MPLRNGGRGPDLCAEPNPLARGTSYGRSPTPHGSEAQAKSGRSHSMSPREREARLSAFPHRWQRWTLPTKIAVVGLPLAVFAILLGLAIARWPKTFRAPTAVPVLPQVQLKSGGIEAPRGEGETLSFADIRNRRVHILRISNPNTVPLASLALTLQFPEAILSIEPQEAAPVYELKAGPELDPQPMSASWPPTMNAPSVVGYGTGNTGLWKAAITAVPAKSSIAVTITTTAEIREDEPYNAWAAKASSARGELLWLLEGTYQYASDDAIGTSEFFVPFEFDRSHRTIVAKNLHPGPLREGDKIRVQQGRGVSIPGVLRTGGYLIAKDRDGGQTYEAPVVLERLDIGVKLGLFGPLRKPGFEVRFKKDGGAH